MNYSAIIVLGNLMDKEGKLNTESSSRMEVAIDAFNNNQAPYIITCGWAYRDDSPIAIADAMKMYAIETGGVPSGSVITEVNSRDTVGDAVFTKINIALNVGWNNFLVVTSDYHISRTYEIFTYVYGEQYSFKVIGAATDTDRNQELSENEKKSIHAFHETFLGIEAGNVELIYERLCEKHPYYNGLVHPRISDD